MSSSYDSEEKEKRNHYKETEHNLVSNNEIPVETIISKDKVEIYHSKSSTQVEINQSLKFVENPIAVLQKITEIYIEQRVDIYEILTGCEIPNEYYIFTKNCNDENRYLFKAKENSGCCVRHFCYSSCRPFELLYKNVFYQNKKFYENHFALFKRECKCACCCCSRPELIGRIINEDSNQYLGKIIDNFSCDPYISIFNQNNDNNYIITGNCCQCGFCCCTRNTCCGRTDESNYEIYYNNTKDNNKKQLVGQINKYSKGFESLIGDADFYKITVPEDIHPYDKLMIISSVILMDYLYYEDKGEEDHHINKTE